MLKKVTERRFRNLRHHLLKFFQDLIFSIVDVLQAMSEQFIHCRNCHRFSPLVFPMAFSLSLPVTEVWYFIW